MKIKIQHKDLYFTSDTHFGHKNIIEYQGRPFSDIMEHNEKLIENWNSVVPKDGIVIHQGDFSLKTGSTTLKWILESLNGKIYLNEGNHERDILKKSWTREYFEDIQQRYEIEVMDGDKFINVIISDHFPLYSWWRKPYDSIHTYGHMHGNYDLPIKNTWDVGVDVNDYKPISYFELLEKISVKNLKL